MPARDDRPIWEQPVQYNEWLPPAQPDPDSGPGPGFPDDPGQDSQVPHKHRDDVVYGVDDDDELDWENETAPDHQNPGEFLDEEPPLPDESEDELDPEEDLEEEGDFDLGGELD